MQLSPDLKKGITPRQARLLSDMSQKQIANLLGVHRHTYMKWERNADEMPVGKARVFSEIVGMPVDEIFFSRHST
ncbi:DNA-binding XRE family transcriptional regulator [Paenibacillus sp. LBL]|uniref:helix-turn-helix transcriptional regulator n=1 Tax=unclassified Paenibacillus TaxID=185978 RepID=UPI0024767D3B|nr:helix-turn-helix domain-containing protein [Paenibacillus sp. LBL]MDH6675772.1 DNA-binding XRE family transcriptional regulator [Paenibacillus sp. LBL]